MSKPPIATVEEFQATIKRKAITAIKELSAKTLERDEASRLIVLTLLACSNMLLIGAPGVAKSFIIKKASFLVKEAEYFEHLMNNNTEPDELLGVAYEGANGEILYNTKGSLVESVIAFVDEIFKASSKMVNSLLGVTSNYREFHQKGSSRGVVKTKILAFFAASNEFSNDISAAPFNDRLHIRLELSRIKDAENFKRLLEGDFDKTDTFSEPFLEDELRMAEGLSKNIVLPPYIKDLLVTIKDRFIREKLESSDRKIENAARIMKVCAFCNARNSVNVSDVLLFVHTAWNDYAERERVKIICYDTLFKSKDYFEAEVEKEEQVKQKSDNFLNNNMEDVFMKRVSLDPKSVSSNFELWMKNAQTLYSNYNYTDSQFQSILDYFEHIKTIEETVKENIFVIDLLKEEELYIRDPYKRSFDDALITRIEDNLVSIRQAQKKVKHFIDNCQSAGDYSSYMSY